MITTNLANTAHATLTDSADIVSWLNAIVTDLMSDWYRLVMKARACGMDIRFAPNCTETLELYFHNDYPDMLLVDKSISCITASKEVAE